MSKKIKDKPFDYLIVGAGLCGSTLAYLLNNAGFSVVMIEKRKHVGGNIYDKNIKGINVHKYGPHIFHTDSKEVWDFINKFDKFYPFINSPIANYKGEVYSLPFNMYTFNKMFGVVNPIIAKKVIDEQRVDIKQPKNLEEQAISLVGLDIYEKLIKGYTEKQWGKPCDELPPDIIKRLPVRFTYDNNYYNDKYQGIPVNGYSKIVKNMLKDIFVINSRDYFVDKYRHNSLANNVIYTGSIDEYFGYKYGELKYRSLSFVQETVYGVEDYQGNAVVNYTSKNVPWTRIIEHKHFLPNKEYKEKCTIITREYPMLWQNGMERYYPINDDENSRLYDKYKELADKEDNVIFVGRLAEYKYYDMDDVILRAFEVFKDIRHIRWNL